MSPLVLLVLLISSLMTRLSSTFILLLLKQVKTFHCQKATPLSSQREIHLPQLIRLHLNSFLMRLSLHAQLTIQLQVLATSVLLVVLVRIRSLMFLQITSRRLSTLQLHTSVRNLHLLLVHCSILHYLLLEQHYTSIIPLYSLTLANSKLAKRLLDTKENSKIDSSMSPEDLIELYQLHTLQDNISELSQTL